MARPQGPVLAHRYHPAHRHQRHPRARYGPGQNHSDRASSKAPVDHLRPPPVWTQTIHHLAIHHTGGTQPSGISWASAIQIAAALAAIGGAATALYRLGQVILRRTILSHRHLAACLNQLACGVTTQYIDQIFGPPAFRRAIDNNHHAEHVYRTRHAWLQTIVNTTDQSVAAFAITVTDPRFAFRTRDLTVDNLDVHLGRTRFSQLTHTPDG